MAEQHYNESGFTMIELIMVIIIVGILAASARALLNTEAFEQRYFADDTLQAMRFAQQIAITQGCAVQLELNNNDGFYLKQDADCGVDDTPDFSHTNYLNRPTSTLSLVPNGRTWRSRNFIFIFLSILLREYLGKLRWIE